MTSLNVFIGWDSRETLAYEVAEFSLRRRASVPVSVTPLKLDCLPMLTRPTLTVDGKLWCPISNAPMATEFAISRFCVPFLQRDGWALYVDCDVLFLADVAELFALADDRYAVMCVKHQKQMSRWSVRYDERCELVNREKFCAEFFVHPAICDQPFGNMNVIFDALQEVIEGRATKTWLLESWKGSEWQFLIRSKDGTALFIASYVGDSSDGPVRDTAVAALKELVEGKMDGQVQTYYARKNWSSVMLWNCRHPANQRLTLEMLNTLPGRDLHRFCWLADSEIGELPREWNHLVGVQPDNPDAKLLHYTMGGFWLPDWKGGPLDELWGKEHILLDGDGQIQEWRSNVLR